MAFFAMMNPLANAPLFVGLTEGFSASEQRKAAVVAVSLAFVIVALFAASGQTIFHLFGITLPAFRIAGGVLIALVGYHMLHGEHSLVQVPSAEDRAKSRDAAFGIAVSPVALPILAGPGTIATAMSFSVKSAGHELIQTLAALGLMCGITLVAFLAGQHITNVLGENVLKVVTRLMGLILAVIGTQMLVDGIRGAGLIGPG